MTHSIFNGWVMSFKKYTFFYLQNSRFASSKEWKAKSLMSLKNVKLTWHDEMLTIRVWSEGLPSPVHKVRSSKAHTYLGNSYMASFAKFLLTAASVILHCVDTQVDIYEVFISYDWLSLCFCPFHPQICPFLKDSKLLRQQGLLGCKSASRLCSRGCAQTYEPWSQLQTADNGCED